MTRLSEALKRAQQTAAMPVTSDEVAPAAAWQFAPVETMPVPAGPPPASAPLIDTEPRRDAGAAPGAAAATPRADLRFGDADRDKLVVGGHVDGALVEQYRHLATVLHHAQQANGARSVMVTSALPSEGKTLTATNLALTLSQSYQRRVLLVDADLRRPRLREMFALPGGPGLTDSLAAGGRLPVHQVSPTLWVLTSGRAIPDPMSTLVSPAMKQLLDDARDSFDWVVVDTPPIAILTDANLLSQMIDTALLVVSAQATPYPMVQRAAQAIGPQRILGVVLNRAEQIGLPDSYSYYGSSGYQRARTAGPRRWFRWRRSHAG
jgi:capsular exopolysaccharide synthesis family protein